ncbi:MAG: ATP-dependent helicase RecG [Eubacteriaceae bacterium]|jgi:predicted HTH transcriptional regulator|nr:ATP-dependent helicase RecG [Eubacteriaceae bacterium]MDK2937411.1 ATP-dependent helicase RecG [Eubacteriaceae bacterium]
MLLNGVSIEKMKEGYSKIRNRGIANAFSYMKIIENWGSGIPRIIKECLDYGLSEPELIDMAGDFRVNLYRGSKNGDKVNDITDRTNQTNQTDQTNQDSLSEAEITLLLLIKENPQMTNAQMAQVLGWNVSRVKYYLQKLKKSSTIKCQGSTHHGFWELLVKIE